MIIVEIINPKVGVIIQSCKRILGKLPYPNKIEGRMEIIKLIKKTFEK
ncbi:MAG: hypothetical protein IK024_08350 [Treponema sp.]|nr:hypothetical protein [Treponema sp.]